LCRKHPELLNDGIDECDEFVSQLMKISPRPISIDVSQTATLLLGSSHMSQRAYKNLKQLLKKSNVKLPNYEAVAAFAKDLDVGNIKTCAKCFEQCMGVFCSTRETLQKIVCSDLFSNMEFKSTEEQEILLHFLKDWDPNTYDNFKVDSRTFFLRQTGDNFRAASRMPTEQISFSILNINEMINNPYGQFVNGIWRGKEYREGLEIHLGVMLMNLRVYQNMELSLRLMETLSTLM